jgi:hypothetical protein
MLYGEKMPVPAKSAAADDHSCCDAPAVLRHGGGAREAVPLPCFGAAAALCKGRV